MGRREESRLYFILGVCGHAEGTKRTCIKQVPTAMNGICESAEGLDCFAKNQNENQKKYCGKSLL